MFNRLSKLDLPGRLHGVAPRPLTQVAVAVSLLALVIGARLVIDALARGVVPSALQFPAILVATLTAGWLCGVMVMAGGGLVLWFTLAATAAPGGGQTSAELVSLGLYFACAGAIIAFAEAHRTNAATLAAGRAALLESEARLALAARAASVGVWEWRLDTGEMIYSAEAKAICGFDPDGPVTFEMVSGIVHRADYPRTSEQARRALDPDIRDNAPYEYRIVLARGEERWVAANGQAVFAEVDGKVVATRYVGTLQDITAAKRVEIERDESALRLRLAIEAGRMAVWQVDAKRGITPSPELNRLVGLPAEARPTMEELNALYMPGEQDRVRGVATDAVARGERFFEAEYRMRRLDGEVRWMQVRAELALGDDGQPRSAIGVILDVTERKAAEERFQLLAREVDHRANNLLAVVQGTVQLSQAPSAAGLKDVLIGRISALGRAHQLLSEARWEGADLRRLVEEELLAFSLGEASRVSIEGPDVALSPAAAQALAMALHELATNAAKYGALSASQGRVAVRWSRAADGPLRLTWTESGGPDVSPPSRRGLGTTILGRALAGPLNGTSTLDWRPDGLVCELELPAEALEAVAV